MLHPPQISVGVWWIIAAIVTAIFLAVCVPLMPTRKYKIRIACAPLLGVVFLAAAASLRGHDMGRVLSIYSTVMIAFPVGIIGRGKELKEAAAQEQRALGGYSEPPPLKLTVQLSSAIVGACMVWVWLSWG